MINTEEYEAAVEDFTKRLIVVELPGDSNYSKHVKKISGINCVLALLHDSDNIITPLPDDFEPPYDPITMWIIAVKNSSEKSRLEFTGDIYSVISHSGRACVCCDPFWNDACARLNSMRLIIDMSVVEGKTYIVVLPIKDDDNLDIKIYLNEVKKSYPLSKHYVYVRGVGMLSEAALNSIE